MKIRFPLAVVIALVVALPLDAVAQKTRRPTGKPKQTTTVAKSEQADSTETAEFKRQLADLAKLPTEQKAKLSSTIGLVQRVTRKVQLTDFPEYFMNDDIVPGEGYKAKQAVDECLRFLPDGLMREVLSGSFEALYDAWAIDLAFKSQIVLDSTLQKIKKYKLEGDSLYLMSRDVLKIALDRAGLAARMFELAKS